MEYLVRFGLWAVVTLVGSAIITGILMLVALLFGWDWAFVPVFRAVIIADIIFEGLKRLNSE